MSTIITTDISKFLDATDRFTNIKKDMNTIRYLVYSIYSLSNTDNYMNTDFRVTKTAYVYYGNCISAESAIKKIDEWPNSVFVIIKEHLSPTGERFCPISGTKKKDHFHYFKGDILFRDRLLSYDCSVSFPQRNRIFEAIEVYSGISGVPRITLKNVCKPEDWEDSDGNSSPVDYSMTIHWN